MIRTETRQTHVTPHFLDGIDHIYVSQQVLECLLAFEPYPEVFYQLINPVPPQATFIQLRPETMDFSQIQDNPRDVLERAFRNNYHVITTNQPLTFQHLGQIYYFQITKTKPAPCVVLTDTEPEVDFLPALIQSSSPVPLPDLPPSPPSPTSQASPPSLSKKRPPPLSIPGSTQPDDEELNIPQVPLQPSLPSSLQSPSSTSSSTPTPTSHVPSPPTSTQLTQQPQQPQKKIFRGQNFTPFSGTGYRLGSKPPDKTTI